MAKIKVLSREITVHSQNGGDYISLTDIARFKDAKRTEMESIPAQSKPTNILALADLTLACSRDILKVRIDRRQSACRSGRHLT